MTPPAPALLSTTTSLCNVTLMRAATSRAMLSVAPPAGPATTMVIGRLGNAGLSSTPPKVAALSVPKSPSASAAIHPTCFRKDAVRNELERKIMGKD
jgi:hypothetical protein